MKRRDVKPGATLVTTVKRKPTIVLVRYLRFAAHERGCRNHQDTWAVVDDSGTYHDRTARELRRR